MGTRGLVAAIVFCAIAGSAWADPKSDVQAKTKEAMESYDSMDYAATKKLLNQALATAKKAKLDKDPVVARLYLNIGIAAFADGDQDGAKVAFLSAVQIDSKIQIEPAYKSPELTKLLEQARGEALGAGVGIGGGEPALGGGECAGVKGLQHTIIDTAPAGTKQSIEVLAGTDVANLKLVVAYRPEGASEFVETKLVKQGECKYVGEIPASAMRGSLVHYYVAALNDKNKAVASRGSSGSPNILELTARAGGSGVKADEEDPINGGKKSGGGASSGVSGGVIAGGKPPKVYIALAGGTGFGYVTGKTEFGNPVENCCLGNSLIVLTPELGYHVNPRLSIGLAARIGLPLGANIDGPKGKSSTVAPAVLLRARYALSPTGQGLRVMGQIGGGILRNTIKLNEAEDGMDTDIVGQGPLLLGAGVGFTKKLGTNLAFIADLSALGAIAVVDKLGNTTNLGSGIGADLSVGMSLGF
ncbi:MAG: tetratricopeptide repeat protein [Deltaproteobacteria bacterium]|nr:tetratricopeptide repeat protein [Deltaproteobacteria bacterium]MDQ3297339.1 tetratricopeptide repeat protein [Myxococcota bacterium]